MVLFFVKGTCDGGADKDGGGALVADCVAAGETDWLLLNCIKRVKAHATFKK